jgi:hypothetical protein
MTEEEAHVIVEAVAALPTGKQVAFVLGMLEKVQEERDRLRAELRRQALQTISDEDQYDENYRIRLAAEAERDRLRAVVRELQECTECTTCRRHATEALMQLDVSPTMGEATDA